MQNSLSVSG